MELKEDLSYQVLSQKPRRFRSLAELIRSDENASLVSIRQVRAFKVPSNPGSDA